MSVKLPAVVALSEAPNVDVHIDWHRHSGLPRHKTVTLATTGLLHFGQQELIFSLLDYSMG